MKLSLTIAATADEHYPAVIRGDPVQGIGQAAAWGYGAVELHLADPARLDWGRVARACAEHRVALTSLGTGLAYAQERLSFTDPSPRVRREAAARICAHLEAAAPFGAPVIIGSLRGSIPSPGAEQRFAGYLTDCLKRCLDQAEKEGVDLVIEAINRYETNLINTAAAGKALIEELGSARLKLHLDTFHMNIEEADPAGAIRGAAGCLSHMHFADSNRRHPGSGHLDFGAITGALKEIAYRGAIGFEYLPWPDPRAAALKGRTHIEALL